MLKRTSKKSYLFSFRSQKNKFYMPRAKKQARNVWQHMFSLLF
ncbi:MAG: hypothetical protein AAB490_01550 [Patescibacteria group bacterium]